MSRNNKLSLLRLLNEYGTLSTGDVAMTAGDVMDSDDADWYRQEVGAEPDPGKL